MPNQPKDPPRTFDPVERVREKQASRDKDAADLKAGRVTKEELRRRNAFIPGDSARAARINWNKTARMGEEG
jgi:hypothetical protein